MSLQVFFRKNALLTSVLVPCLIILSLMLALCLTEYQYAYNFARQSTIDAQQAALSGAAARLDNALHNIETLAGSINSSRVLGESVNQSIKTGTAFAASKVTQSLPYLQTDSTLTGYYFLFLDASGQILAPRQAMLSPRVYYGCFFGTDNISYEQWEKDTLIDPVYSTLQPVKQMLIDGVSKEVLTYTLPYMSKANARKQGTFVFYIYLDGMRKLFSPYLDTGSHSVYITGKDEMLAYFCNDPEAEISIEVFEAYIADHANGTIARDIRGERMIFSRVTLSNSDISLCIATPVRVFEKQASHMLSFMILMIIITMTAVALVMIKYIHSVRGPLTNLSNRLERSRNGLKNPFSHLEQAFSRVTGDNATLNTQLKKHQAAILESVISNKSINDQVYSLLSENIPNPFGTNVYFRGIYLKICSKVTMSEDEQYAAVSYAVTHTQACLKVLSRRSENMLALLYLSDSDRSEDARIQIDELRASLLNVHRAACQLYVGPVSDSLQRVCYSFSEAWRLSEAMEDNPEGQTCLTDESAHDTYYLLRDSDANALQNACMEGDSDEMLRCLSHVFEDNYLRAKLPMSMYLLLFARLSDLLTRCKSGDTLSVAGLDILLEEPPESAFDWLKQRFIDVTEQNRQKRLSNAQELNRQVVEHIQMHFRDPDLCLTSIASVFGMTESYLSVLIKHTLNQNYSTYLNNLRIQYANGLLAEKKYGIEQISEMSGYTNSVSFRRAYKRTVGYSPSEYLARQQEPNMS